MFLKKIAAVIGQKLQIRVDNYPWGRLRVIERGTAYKAVLHPQHWDLVLQGKGGFKDEQGIFWAISRESENIVLTSGGRKLVLTPKDVAKMQ